jgi:acyl-CoA thioesterase FadM
MPFLRRGSVRIHHVGGAGHAANTEFAEAFNSGVHEFLEEI